MVKSNSLQEWRERHGRALFNIDFKPLTDGANFFASFQPIFTELRIARTFLSPGLSFRDEELVKDCDDAYALGISLSTGLEFSHRGGELRIGRGDAALLHLSEIGTCGSRFSFGYIAVPCPASELAERGTHADGAVMRRIPSSLEALKLLRAYLRAIEPAGPNAWGDSAHIVRQHILDLTALVITRHDAVGESELGAVAAARLSAALEYIAQNFTDPEVSVATVAHAQRISPRYLHRLIAASGASFVERVNDLRLKRAFVLLTEMHGKKQQISDIALQVGFSDISHFNRLFRARFGDSPRGVRRRSAESLPDCG